MFTQVEFETAKGVIYIEGPVTDKYLESLRMNDRLRNFRPPEQQKKALMTITTMPDGMIYLARYEDEIIAYVTFHHPDEYTRWSKHPNVLEMGGIEVSPDWRNCRVGENLMKTAFSNINLEHFIVITLEYCWHWDLKNSGLDVWQYQKVLGKIFGKVGLNKVTTDDPEIREHPANVLMARFGAKVSKQDLIMFESLRFQTKYHVVANMC